MGKTGNYDEEFKKRAVQMLKNSEKSKTQIARELDISVASLRSWGNKYMEENSTTKKANSTEMTKEELLAELIKTKKELSRVTEQREILKKAAAILGN